MKPTLKRSNAPIFWALFGAGGMLSALLGPMLVFITGIAVPLGLLLLPPDTMSYAAHARLCPELDRQGLHLRGHRALPVARRAPHLSQPARHRYSRRHRRQAALLRVGDAGTVIAAYALLAIGF
jgi:fumarate reductase subunit D